MGRSGRSFGNEKGTKLYGGDLRRRFFQAVKMAALGAFAVLALVLGGFYFFRVPAAPTPVKVGTVGQPDGANRTTHTDTSGPKTQSK